MVAMVIRTWNGSRS